MNRLQQIQARLAEIRGLLTKPDADLDALETEISALETERGNIEAAAAKRAELEARVLEVPSALASHPSRPTPSSGDAPSDRSDQRFDASAAEYKAAFLKGLIHKARGTWELGELTDLEKRAWTYLTTNTTAVLPTGIQLGIVDMIREKYSLLGDLTMTGFQGAVEFQQATTVVEGDAAETNENTANAANLKITFAKVGMTGVEIRDSLKIGNKMRLQSIDQFESWMVDTLSDRLGRIMNLHVVDAIEDDMVVANAFATAAGVALTAADIREAFGALKGGQGARRVYANNYTIWNHIAAVEDENGQEKFIQSSLDSDPATQGRLYGAPVRLDETLDDNEIFIGYPAQVKANMFEAPNVESDRDVETRETVFGGYALFEARLGDTRAWAKITVTPAAVS